jgi:deoxyadenosine/deoxycytidine kinase
MQHHAAEQPRNLEVAVALEGNIGVGKSTLVRRLLGLYGEREIKSLYEDVNEKLLATFYMEPATYAFTMQMCMVLTRIRNYDRWCLESHNQLPAPAPTSVNAAVTAAVTAATQAANKEPEPIVAAPAPSRKWLFDRSLLGDYVFAIINYLLGNLKRDQFETYLTEYNRHMPISGNLPSLYGLRQTRIVLLDDEPSNCRSRVLLDRGNLAERGIPLDYYHLLDDIHFHVFVRNLFAQDAGVDCTVRTWWQYNSNDALTWWPATTAAPVAPLMSPRVIHGSLGDEMRGRAGSFAMRNGIPTINGTFVYTHLVMIEEVYRLLHSADAVAHQVSYASMLARKVEDKNMRLLCVPCVCMGACRGQLTCGAPTYGHLLAQLAAQTEVLVPDLALGNDCRDKVYDDRAQELGIRFYSNAYKRVVCWHLSRGQRIVFYKL